MIYASDNNTPTVTAVEYCKNDMEMSWSTSLDEIFPPSARFKSLTDMHSWSFGSCKILRVPENQSTKLIILADGSDSIAMRPYYQQINR